MYRLCDIDNPITCTYHFELNFKCTVALGLKCNVKFRFVRFDNDCCMGLQSSVEPCRTKCSDRIESKSSFCGVYRIYNARDVMEATKCTSNNNFHNFNPFIMDNCLKGSTFQYILAIYSILVLEIFAKCVFNFSFNIET